MKRILVKEDLNTRINSLRESIREKNSPMTDLKKGMASLKKLFREEKRRTADVAKKIKTLKKSLREGERTEQDIEALKDIQKEFDYFIKKMIDDKLLLAGLEIGGDDAYYDEY